MAGRMIHLVVEYTHNIDSRADIPTLLGNANRVLAGVLQTPDAVVSRAYELQDYHMADGQADYAFVHATLRVGAGLTDELKRQASEAVFNMFKQHFAPLYASRYLALSMELVETTGERSARITA